MMKKIVGTLVVGVVVLVAGFSVGRPPAAAAPKLSDPGKAVFLDYRCNKCHTVNSAGIKVLKKKQGVVPPDLSTVGKNHPRAWIAKFIKKEETLDGRKHRLKFTGDATEESALLDWLSSLKTANK